MRRATETGHCTDRPHCLLLPTRRLTRVLLGRHSAAQADISLSSPQEHDRGPPCLSSAVAATRSARRKPGTTPLQTSPALKSTPTPTRKHPKLQRLMASSRRAIHPPPLRIGRTATPICAPNRRQHRNNPRNTVAFLPSAFAMPPTLNCLSGLSNRQRTPRQCRHLVRPPRALPAVLLL